MSGTDRQLWEVEDWKLRRGVNILTSYEIRKGYPIMSPVLQWHQSVNRPRVCCCSF